MNEVSGGEVSLSLCSAHCLQLLAGTIFRGEAIIYINLCVSLITNKRMSVLFVFIYFSFVSL